MVSFWKESPGPHWSHTFTNFLGTPPTPHVFQDTVKKPEFEYVVLNTNHVPDIHELLLRNYVMYPRSKINLSREQIQRFLEVEQCLAIGIYFNLMLAGVVISRPLGFVMLGDQSVEQTQIGLIDFFCVHEKHRKKGVGSKLLRATAYESSKRGYIAHLFLKEGMPLTFLPPLYSSTFVWRRRQVPAPVNLSNFIRPAKELPRGSPFWNAPTHIHHTKTWECFAFQPPIYVAVTNLFHTSSVGNLTMGEISWVWYNQKKGIHSQDKLIRVLETVVDSYGGYDMIFMDSAIAHDANLWSTDALFSYYVWNFHPGTFFKLKPALTF